MTRVCKAQCLSFLVWVALACHFGSPARAGELCPQTLETSQAAPAPSGDYAVVVDALGPSRLTYISMFEGPPEQMADLVPDRNEARFAQWDFPKSNQSAGHWIGCHYSRTNLMLTRNLPASTKRCTVTYSNRDEGLIEGSKPLKSVSCE
jgi:hypothetical protein